MNGLKNWRASPVTLGLLVALVVACVTVVGWVVKGESALKAMSVEAVKAHCNSDVDRAHNDLPRKYVPRVELKDMLHAQARTLDRVEQTQKTILKRLSEPRRRGR